MYIEEISIENYKAIVNLKLKLKPGMNLLIGDNGVGKTSVLDAVVVALGGFLNGVNGVPARGIFLSDVHMSTWNVGSASTSIRYDTPVKIGCRLHAGGQIYEWERIREDESPSRRTKTEKKAGDIFQYAKELTNNVYQELPVFSYQSSVRASQTKRSDFGAQMKKRMDDRRCGYLGCLDSVLDLKQVKEWCYEMQRAAFERNCKINEHEQFKQIVGRFMQQMSEGKEMPQIYYSRQHKDIVYEENHEVLPISYLSAGYQSVLWMIMDIAYRLAILNPAKENLSEAGGIILIDEIDMHLHPKWQWNVIHALENIFPNIQFVIATHSPIIISSAKSANLLLMDERQEVSRLKDAYGYSVNDVLELCQGSSDISKNMKLLREKFDFALNGGNYAEAEQLVKKMEAEYGEDNTEVRKAKTELEVECTL